MFYFSFFGGRELLRENKGICNSDIALLSTSWTGNGYAGEKVVKENQKLIQVVYKMVATA